MGQVSEITGKHVLVVEDMYDTGQSMQRLLSTLQSLGPMKVQTCVAFHKKTEKNISTGYFADFIGFFVPDSFVIGYGMDYNEKFRDVQHLCVLNEKGIAQFSE